MDKYQTFFSYSESNTLVKYHVWHLSQTICVEQLVLDLHSGVRISHALYVSWMLRRLLPKQMHAWILYHHFGMAKRL